MQWVFFILAMLVAVSAIAAVTLRKLIHCALCLAAAFAALAGHYLFLGAEFVGFAQILIYVGAVAILIVFAILLTRENQRVQAYSLSPAPWMIGAGIAAAVGLLLSACVAATGMLVASAARPPELTVRQIGQKLMTDYVLPLEVLGLLLTAAAIGAVVIALPERKKP